MKKILALMLVVVMLAGGAVTAAAKEVDVDILSNPHFITWNQSAPQRERLEVVQLENGSYYIQGPMPMLFTGLRVWGLGIFSYDLKAGVDYSLGFGADGTTITLLKPLDVEPGNYVLRFEFPETYAIAAYSAEAVTVPEADAPAAEVAAPAADAAPAETK